MNFREDPMINISSKHLVTLKRILNRHCPDDEVLAFGSRVSGKCKPYSDLDLVLKSTGKLPLGVIAELKDALSESDLPFRVDVLDWMTLNENFKNIILANAEVLN
jgi:predicted nucleotidyltransferase